MGTKQGQLRSSGTANQGASSQVFRRIHYLCITTEHAYMRAPGGGSIAEYSVKRKLNMFSIQSCDVLLAKLYSAVVANISRKHTPHAIHPVVCATRMVCGNETGTEESESKSEIT